MLQQLTGLFDCSLVNINSRPSSKESLSAPKPVHYWSGDTESRAYPEPVPGYSVVCKPYPYSYHVCYHLLYNGKLRTIKDRRSFNNPKFSKLIKKNRSSFKNGEIMESFGRVI